MGKGYLIPFPKFLLFVEKYFPLLKCVLFLEKYRGSSKTQRVIASILCPIFVIGFQYTCVKEANNLVKCILTEQGGKGGGGGGLSLLRIEITTPPSKKSYIAEERLDTHDMVVTAYYGMNGVELAHNEIQEYTISPAPLVDHTTQVTVSYTYMGTTCSATVDGIQVTHRVKSIEVKTNSGKVDYEYLDELQTEGYTVTATYSDQQTQDVTNSGITYTPTSLTTIGQQPIQASYTENSVTVTCQFNVNVNKKKISDLKAEPEVIQVGANGGTSKITFSGDGTATIEESSFMPEITLVTIAKQNEGQWTVSATGNGTSPVPLENAKQLVVTIQDSEHYTYDPKTVTVKITAQYWTWGNENEVGEEDWWAGLKSSLANSDMSTRQNYVGKKKKVKLTKAMNGWNDQAQISMICIGYDIDAEKSLTFQTEGCSPTGNAFSSSSALWNDSQAKTQAQEFAENCSASKSILEVTKLTSKECNNQQNNAADVETPCKGFLPSECEMGFQAQNGQSAVVKGYAPSYTEWTKDRNGPAYQYYVDNNSRKKFYCTTDGNLTSSTYWYWERSRYYITNYSGTVCYVNTGGGPSYGDYNTSNGRLAPAFVIG